MPFLNLCRLSRDEVFSAVFWLGICLIWAVALLLPLYPDEIAYRAINSRVFFDHLQSGNVYPPCATSFAIPTPISWLPARAIDYLAFGWYNNPVFYRVVSLVTLIGAATGVRMLLRHLGYGAPAFRIFVLTLSFGMIPFALVLVRPEALIFASLVWLIALGLDPKQVRYGGVLSALCFFILSSLLLSLHPKTFLLVPALLIIFWVWSRRQNVTPFARWALGATLACLIFESARYWPRYVGCHQNMDKLAVSPNLLMTDPLLFISQYAENFFNSWKYVQSTFYEPTYSISWIPSPPEYFVFLTFTYILNALFVVLILTACCVSITGLMSFIKTRPGGGDIIRSARTSPANLIGLILVLDIAFYSGINMLKNYYEISYMFPLLTIAVFLFTANTSKIEKLANNKNTTKALPYVSTAMLILFSINFVVIYWHGFSGAGISFLTFSDRATRAEINQLLPACNIPEDPAQSTHLIVDDTVYQYFRESYKPILMQWLVDPSNLATEKEFLKRFKTAGVISRCHLFNQELRSSPYFHSTTDNPNSLTDLCCMDGRYYDAP